MRYLLIILSLFLFSCSGTKFDKNLIHARKDINPTIQLLPLHANFENFYFRNTTIFDIMNANQDIQNPIATLFKREIEQNVCMPNSDNQTYGYVDLSITYIGHSPKSFYNYFVSPILHIGLYGTLTIIGMPITISNTEMEFELTIYDLNKNKIKSYIKSNELDFSSNIYNLIFKQYETMLKISRATIKDFHDQILLDAEYINKKLHLGSVKK